MEGLPSVLGIVPSLGILGVAALLCSCTRIFHLRLALCCSGLPTQPYFKRQGHAYTGGLVRGIYHHTAE